MVDPRTVPPTAFEAMVVDALDDLPESVLPVVGELAVLVEDEPDPGAAPTGGQLLGVFHGVPEPVPAAACPAACRTPSPCSGYRSCACVPHRRRCRHGCGWCCGTRSATRSA